jgi:acetyl esterase
LQASGVVTDYVCYDAQVHGFITMGKVIAQANQAVAQCASALRAALS